MRNKMDVLHFEFANQFGEKNPLCFQEPKQVIEARSIEEVLPGLRKVQEAAANGMYAAGYLSYEAAPAFDVAFKTKPGSNMPLLWFGIFDEPVPCQEKRVMDYTVTDWVPDQSIDEYNEQLQKIKDLIEVGDTYQVNYTLRMRSHFQGDDYSFFEELNRAQSANYSCYLRTGDFSILSASPELFFRVSDRSIITRPMKGTIKRGKTDEEDKHNEKWLAESDKNRAENLMIVDLIRNDLSRIAKTGTVKVPSLFEIERYPTVFQMTSTITAELADDVEFIDVLTALFPCGSITGAPKVRTMEIISELERSPREVYCGAIGYIAPNGDAVFNVPIRTVVINNRTGEAQYGVGGGITWDSTFQDEYEEILAKANILERKTPKFQLLESLRLENGEYFLLREHLDRLMQSAAYFGYSVNLFDLKTALHEFAKRHSKNVHKVRLLVSQQGEMEIEGQEIEDITCLKKVALANYPVKKEDSFLFHKTTNRKQYDQLKTAAEGVFDVLLWNECGELTEFTIGNLVMEIDGQRYTPFVESGLLPGTFRRHLLETGQVTEKVLTVAELTRATRIWLVNSVRKWVEVEVCATK